MARQWHTTKNGNLTPNEVTINSNKKVWWKCDKGSDHEWEAIINSRAQGNGCSICGGKKVVASNCLATLNPELEKQWHPTKNGTLTPYDVTICSNKKVWWKCEKGSDHEWEAMINNRTKGKGCSICAGLKVVLSNCLATLNPELAKQWHPSKNETLSPYDVTIGSDKKVWWKCEKGDDHEWEASIDNRTKGNGCSICRGLKVVVSNCLATLDPELAKEWHPTRNGALSPYDVTVSSNKKVWWKCNKGPDHEWKTSIAHRTNGKGCSICRGLKVVVSNCLATLNPKLAKQWHPTKNGTLTPYDFTVGTRKKVWWKCEKGVDHEWEASIVNRIYGTACPFCTLTPQSKQELTITFELKTIFKDINPRGFKTRVKGKLWTIDIYIPQLHLGIEFDGSHWHKDKLALDKLKTDQIKKEGFSVIRVREEPLKKLSENDVISHLPYNGKQVVNDILKQIMNMYKPDGRKVRQIENYIAKDKLQNEKGLNKYIDMRLTENANRIK